jgi:transposase
MSQYTTQTLKHLGLVAAMVDELGIVSTLDTLIEQDSSQRNVSVGVAIKAMILNGLGFANRQLYLVPQFFENKLLDRLLGEGIESSYLNDKVLGRALDTLYEKGVTALFGIIAVEELKRLGITSEYLHLDSTAFHVDGAYTQTVAQDTAEPSIIKITQGYSKNHRPDLNQVMLNMIVVISSKSISLHSNRHRKTLCWLPIPHCIQPRRFKHLQNNNALSSPVSPQPSKRQKHFFLR